MKKSFVFLLVFLLMAALSVPAFATENEIVSWDDFYPQSERYPDAVGGMYYDSNIDGSNTGNCLLVVDPTPERVEELRAQYGGHMTITPCKYSYTELMRVHYEIYTRMLDQNNKIYSAGVGWHSSDGVVTGFGESGKEFRLVVGVDESEFGRYSAEFAERYGDMVFVESSSGVMAFDSADAGGDHATPFEAAVVESEYQEAPVVDDMPHLADGQQGAETSAIPTSIGRRMGILKTCRLPMKPGAKCWTAEPLSLGGRSAS